VIVIVIVDAGFAERFRDRERFADFVNGSPIS
jgi:hypothetical protein